MGFGGGASLGTVGTVNINSRGFMLPFSEGRIAGTEVVTGDIENMKRLSSIQML